MLSVDFDEVLGAGEAVVAVDVLGEDPGVGFLFFDAGEDFVSAVGLGVADGLEDLPEVFPGDIGLGFEEVVAQGEFDGDPFIGGFIFVESADAAVGGEAGVGGESGAGDEEWALAGEEQFADAVLIIHVRVG